MARKGQTDFLTYFIIGVIAAAVILGVILVLKGKNMGVIATIHNTTTKGVFG